MTERDEQRAWRAWRLWLRGRSDAEVQEAADRIERISLRRFLWLRRLRPQQ